MQSYRLRKHVKSDLKAYVHSLERHANEWYQKLRKARELMDQGQYVYAEELLGRLIGSDLKTMFDSRSRVLRKKLGKVAETRSKFRSERISLEERNQNNGSSSGDKNEEHV